MNRTRIRVIAPLLALCVGVVCILVAHDLRAWRSLLQDDAIQYSDKPTVVVPQQAPTVLPRGLSQSLLGVGTDREWLDALRRFAIAYQDTLGVNSLGRSDYVLLNRGVAALRQVTQDSDPTRASQAYNLLGVLVFREATPGTSTDPTLLQAAVTDLQNAVRLDPTDEPAKKNLELGLRVLIAVNRVQQGQAPGTKATTKRQGGYGGPPGEGY